MHFKILSRGLIAVVGCFAFAASTSDAWAQQSGLFGGSSTTTGSNGLGMANTGSSFSSSAFPSSAFPAGGTSTTGGQQGLGAPGGLGAAGQQSTLLGLSNGTNLIGTGAAAGQNPAGQAGQMPNRQGMQNRNNANRRTGQNRNQANQATGAGAANQQGRSIRPQLVVGFDHARPAADATQAAIATRFSKLASKTEFKNIQVEMDGDVVVLRGQVDTERSGKVAVVLARMEPGVKTVRNELTVAESSAPAATE
jgi:hypothetical protein